MTGWSGRTSDGSYGLLIDELALRELDRMCRDAGATETGGILVGLYSADLGVAVVREATPPPSDSRRGPSWFDRGVAGLRDMLSRRWHSAARNYYLGEWHYHPAAQVEPSAADIEQMYRIRDNPNYRCAEPVMVIFGTVAVDEERAARAFVFPPSQPHQEFMLMPDAAPAADGLRGPVIAKTSVSSPKEG